jgi:NAD(P)-dependent dehydrogenase (short-subunit alcohol dehydrogenase family)
MVRDPVRDRCSTLEVARRKAKPPGAAAEVSSRLGWALPGSGMGAVADIAEAIVYLASDRAAFMTGSEMVVDGGLTAQ